MLQKIVVPIDFSPPSLQTLRYAVAFAQRFGANLLLLHVVDPPPVVRGGVLPPQFATELVRSATKRLTDLAAQFSLSPETNPITVVTGATGDEINKAAREMCADLIVLASRGYSGLRYAFFGSTAENVLRHAMCPVLILRAEKDAPEASPLHLRKIVVPVDFSENAALGMNYALEFARESNAEVVLFHAVSMRPYFLGDEYTARAMPPLIPQYSEYAKSEMANLSGLASQKGHRVGTQIALGSPVEELASYVQRENVDMIIMSTHGRTGLSRWLIGNTAEQIARYVSCAVLVVPVRSASGCDDAASPIS